MFTVYILLCTPLCVCEGVPMSMCGCQYPFQAVCCWESHLHLCNRFSSSVNWEYQSDPLHSSEATLKASSGTQKRLPLLVDARAVSLA